MQLIVFPDPVAEVMGYLAEHSPGLEVGQSLAQAPRPDSHEGLYVQVVDGGGGPWEHVFDDARITVEVSHPDSVEASNVARRCDALLRAYAAPKGRWLSTVSHPRCLPDPDLRLPAYVLTHTLRFRGEEVTTP